LGISRKMTTLAKILEMKKRVCFMVDSIFTIGGVQRVTAVIAEALTRYYDVTILTFDSPETSDTSLYQPDGTKIKYRFFSYPPTVSFLHKINKVFSWFYLKSRPQSEWASNLYAHSSFPAPLRKALTHELQEGKYNVIIGVHAPLAARLASMKRDLPRVKTIGWIHNSFEALFGSGSHYIGEARKRHYVYQFRKLDDVVVLCHHDAETYTRYDWALRPAVIYNPLTLEPGKRSTGNSKRFLAVGRFAPQHKGFDLLIEAFHLFAQKDKEWKLDIIGEGPEESLYRNQIAKYRLDTRVLLHPFTKHIQEYYSNAQIYVLSSRWEGMPLVLVEAMSHGLPVVASDLPVCKEIMGDFAFYFKKEDIEELSQRLEEVTHINWQQKSQQALDIAGQYHLENIIGQWQKFIDA
jgi:glycosyltransferase involved in cell wall biosynthesis